MSEKDYLDELIEENCKDPEFAKLWEKSEESLRLMQMRADAGLTQQEVANRMGVARPRVAEIEKAPDKVSFGRLRKYMLAIGGSIELKAPANGGRSSRKHSAKAARISSIPNKAR